MLTPDPRTEALTPMETLAAVRDWVNGGISRTLEEDPSGFLLGTESGAILDALDALAARLSQAAEALVAMQDTAADLAMQRAEMRRALGKAEEALREIGAYVAMPGHYAAALSRVQVIAKQALAASSAGETPNE